MNIPALRSEVQHYLLLREKLLASFTDLDEDTIRDTLEGLTTLDQLIAEIVRSALVDQALQAGLRLRLDEMKERLGRLALREEKKRELAFEAMSDAGLKRIEAPDFTVTTRAGAPALIVTAENEIPAPYWLAQPPKLDRQRLLSELKSGAAVDGVELSNPKPVLSVRKR
jgi:Gp157 protein